MADDAANNRTGMVLRIERSSIYDGEGFRTVVFLKGCPLRCLWCSTPESQSFEVEVAEEGKIYGSRMSVDELMKEIRKDSVFYFHSGGGLTLSGGEPLSQADFSAELLSQAHGEGINTAMETCLAASFVQVGKTLPHLDVVYADFKHIDPKKHKEFCGIDNALILENIRRIDELGAPRLIVRIPLVPGINDDDATLEGMASFCSELKNLRGVQLLPYHRLGIDTYRKLGRTYPLSSLQRPDDARMESCRAIFRRHVGEVI